MSSRGPIYDFRIKLQRMAYWITSPQFMSEIYFRIRFKRKLNLHHPHTFNEKIQWLKLNYCPNHDRVITCTDKYRVREYLAEKGLEQYAVPLIGYWEKVSEINWDELPNRFVIKCNHGCAYNIICRNKNQLDIQQAKKQLSRWLREDYGQFNAEPHYSLIRRGIVCEEYLGDGIHDYLVDYKVHCFNGRPENILVCTDRFAGGATYQYYNLEWDKLPYSEQNSSLIKKPSCLDEILEISKMISQDFPFVRVDFYIIHDRPIIGELTFVPAAGLDAGISHQADEEMGAMLDLSHIK